MRTVLCLTGIASAACEHRRTAVVVVVDTNMLQGDAVAAPGSSRYRLTRLEANVTWGPTPDPTENALNDRYDVRVGAPNDLDAAVARVRLPYPIFYLQSPDPSTPRWVHVTVRAEVVDAAGAPVSVGPFERTTRFVEGVTHTQVVYVDDRCVGRVCPAGQTCGLGGNCIPVMQEPPGPAGSPKGTLGPPGGGPCPDGPGFCVTPTGDAGATDDLGDAGVDLDGATDDLGDARGDGGADASVDMGPASDADPLAPGACSPVTRRDEDNDEVSGGGTCNGLRGAFTARGINVGYYPFRLLVETPLVYDVRAGEAGAVIATAPENALVALASTGPNYSTRCQVDAGVVRVCCPAEPTGYCTNADSACESDIPPLRAWRRVPGDRPYAFWGYVVEGEGAGTLGWFLFGPSAALYDGRTGRRDTAGPRGNEFEVAGCGAYRRPDRATSCAAVNRCDEGDDGCQRCPGDACRRRLDPTANRSDVIRPRSGAADSSWGPSLRWAAHSSPKGWLRWGDRVQVYYRTRDRNGDWWAFVEVLRAPGSALTPANGSPVDARCNAADGWSCDPCRNGGTCGWVDGRYLEAAVFDGADGC